MHTYVEARGTFPPDKKLYPIYDAWLETSMKEEPVEYFREMRAKNAAKLQKSCCEIWSKGWLWHWAHSIRTPRNTREVRAANSSGLSFNAA